MCQRSRRRLSSRSLWLGSAGPAGRSHPRCGNLGIRNKHTSCTIMIAHERMLRFPAIRDIARILRPRCDSVWICGVWGSAWSARESQLEQRSITHGLRRRLLTCSRRSPPMHASTGALASAHHHIQALHGERCTQYPGRVEAEVPSACQVTSSKE